MSYDTQQQADEHTPRNNPYSVHPSLGAGASASRHNDRFENTIEPAHENSRSLQQYWGLFSRGNAPLRTAAMHHTQQTCGNRAVQRLLRGSVYGMQSESGSLPAEMAVTPLTETDPIAQRPGQPQPPATTSSRRALSLQRANDKEDQSSKSKQSKPKDAPRGTKPIDQSGLDKDDVHTIKAGVGAGPKDWVGISPEGHVITGDEEGNAVDNGPAADYLNKNATSPAVSGTISAPVEGASGEMATSGITPAKVLKALEVLGLSIGLTLTVYTLLMSPDWKAKLLAAGLTVAELEALAALLGISMPSGEHGTPAAAADAPGGHGRTAAAGVLGSGAGSIVDAAEIAAVGLGALRRHKYQTDEERARTTR